MEYGIEDLEGYEIWKIFIPFHSIACPGDSRQDEELDTRIEKASAEINEPALPIGCTKTRAVHISKAFCFQIFVPILTYG